MKELQKQFLGWSGDERVEKINDALKVKPLKQVAEEVTGCSVTWLRGHMATLGRVYSKSLGQYILADLVETKKPFRGELEGLDGLEELLVVRDQLLALVNKPQTAGFDFKELYEQGEVITRSLKTYTGALAAFDAVCDKAYPQYKRQDLLGLALLEFAKKYSSKP